MRFKKYIKESASLTTTLQESLHCVGLGISQLTSRNISEVDLLNSDLFNKSYEKYCKVDIGLNTLYEFAQNNPSWVKSVVGNVNGLINSKWIKGKNYTFCRGIGIMRDVYSMSKSLASKEGIKLNPDKWNPGDIWATKISSIPSFKTLTEYNEFISQQLLNGNLIGISLKKSKGTPKIKYIDQKSDKIDILYKGVKKPTTPFNTGLTILTNNPNLSINVRSFRTSKKTAITCEIIMKGGSARHGKKTPAPYIKKYNIPQMSVTDISKIENDTKYINNMILTLWKDLGYTFSNIDKFWEKRAENIDNLTGFYRSIINSLQFALFLQQNGKKGDDILTDIFAKASSSGDYSSDFIKVY